MIIENYFISNDFINLLKPLKEIMEKNDIRENMGIIQFFISATIKYNSLFSNENELTTNELNEFIKKIVNKVIELKIEHINKIYSNIEFNKFVSELSIKKIEEKAKIDQSLSEKEYKEKIYKFLIKNYKEAKYHAFNSSVYESIKENGINPDYIKRDDINKIEKIFEKYNIQHICGWNSLNCNGTVSYSYGPEEAYYYAVSSPEWFSQFTGEAFAYNPSQKFKKTAFIEGDYEAAKNNLITIMFERNFNQEDINEVLRFFEEKWKIYAKKEPLLAIVPDTLNENKINRFLKNDKATIKEKIYSDFMTSFLNDLKTDQKIDTDNAIYIKLPKVNQVLDKIYKRENIKEEKNLKEKIVEIKYPTTYGLDGLVHKIEIEKILKLEDETILLIGFDETIKNKTTIHLEYSKENNEWIKKCHTNKEYEKLFKSLQNQKILDATLLLENQLIGKKLENSDEVKSKQKIQIFLNDNGKKFIYLSAASVLHFTESIKNLLDKNKNLSSLYEINEQQEKFILNNYIVEYKKIKSNDAKNQLNPNNPPLEPPTNKNIENKKEIPIFVDPDQNKFTYKKIIEELGMTINEALQKNNINFNLENLVQITFLQEIKLKEKYKIVYKEIPYLFKQIKSEQKNDYTSPENTVEKTPIIKDENYNYQENLIGLKELNELNELITNRHNLTSNKNKKEQTKKDEISNLTQENKQIKPLKVKIRNINKDKKTELKELKNQLKNYKEQSIEKNYTVDEIIEEYDRKNNDKRK